MYSYFIRNNMAPQPGPASKANKALLLRNLRPVAQTRHPRGDDFRGYTCFL